MKIALPAARLLPLLLLLGACNSPVADQPITGDQPAPPADSIAPPDTVATRPVRSAVPFVSPTKVGRVLGEQSPSPAASRTR